jgi:hypothetical protein
MNPEESEFIDEIVQDKLPAHTEPVRDTFLPWHRVRKEYIRQLQWNILIKRMIDRQWNRQLHRPEMEWSLDDQPERNHDIQQPAQVDLEKVLKCLIIPGNDLLDIRALIRDIQYLRCVIRYIGFNESQGSNNQGTHVHIANNAVTSLPMVVRDSFVMQDRFETIRHRDSQAYRYLKEYGPYHVVNLDFCGSMFPNTTKDSQEYYDAILQLLGYQFEFQKTEWLLFITTMVKPAVVRHDTMRTLCIPTRDNILHYCDFAERIRELIPIEPLLDEAIPINNTVINDEQMIRLFGLALGKWLLNLCQQATPKWSIAMRRSYCYTISEENGAEMLSLAFEFKPNVSPPIDTTGMAGIELPPRHNPDECECAIKLVESVTHIRDVDTELLNDPELKNRLRDAQADLLEAAGYNRMAYLRWVESGERN